MQTSSLMNFGMNVLKCNTQGQLLYTKYLSYCCWSQFVKRGVLASKTASRNQTISCVKPKPVHHFVTKHQISSFKSCQINNLLPICNLRFFSKDNNDTPHIENNNVDFINKINEEVNSEKDELVTKDPWIKSILADINKDFATEHSKDSSDSESSDDSSSDSDSENNPEVSHENVKLNVSSDKSSPEEPYEYDYRYADENDIEEFGYHDEQDFAETRPEKVLPISLERSKDGVFELDELITLMEHLGAENIVSVPIPPEVNFCDHMVVVTAKSKRHLKALTDEMLWVHKRKKSRKEPVLHIEGLNKSQWCAMDMGNLVLHIFLNDEIREYYDIESLWLLGPENDPKCKEEYEQESYVLSSEDLFWLEVTGSKEPKSDEKTDS